MLFAELTSPYLDAQKISFQRSALLGISIASTKQTLTLSKVLITHQLGVAIQSYTDLVGHMRNPMDDSHG